MGRIDALLSEAKSLLDESGSFNADKVVELIRSNPLEKTGICLPESFLANLIDGGLFPHGMYISAIFDLGPALTDYLAEDVSLFVLQAINPTWVVIGEFENNPRIQYSLITWEEDDYSFSSVDPYRETIEYYLETGSLGGLWYSTTEKQFNEIPSSEFIPHTPYSYCYSKQFFELKSKVKQGDIRPLKEITTIVKPTIIEGGKLEYVAKRFSGYPFKVDLGALEKETDTKLQLNDIVITPDKAFLVDKEPDPSCCASADHLVLRNPDISPEYLLLFLESRTGKALRRDYLADCPAGISLAGYLPQLPVIMPPTSRPTVSIHTIFELTYSTKDDASSFDYSVKTPKNLHAHNARDLFSIDLFKGAVSCRNAGARRMIEEDIAELERCFACEAYKATLIMAGSILEAFLIDWLSSIKGVNYFENDYYVLDKDTGEERRADDLYSYINEIKEIKHPKWMEEAKKAHHIRIKRNTVHAKLCLKQDKRANEETCREVISYLKEIIETRNTASTR